MRNQVLLLDCGDRCRSLIASCNRRETAPRANALVTGTAPATKPKTKHNPAGIRTSARTTQTTDRLGRGLPYHCTGCPSNRTIASSRRRTPGLMARLDGPSGMDRGSCGTRIEERVRYNPARHNDRQYLLWGGSGAGSRSESRLLPTGTGRGNRADGLPVLARSAGVIGSRGEHRGRGGGRCAGRGRSQLARPQHRRSVPWT